MTLLTVIAQVLILAVLMFGVLHLIILSWRKRDIRRRPPREHSPIADEEMRGQIILLTEIARGIRREAAELKKEVGHV